MTRPKPRRPRADVVARRFKRGEDIESIAFDEWIKYSDATTLKDCRKLVEDALRRSMNRGRRA